MATSRLEMLPTEIVHQIGTYLRDTHKPSLRSLSVSSTACRAATLPIVLGRICLTVRGPAQLARDAEELLSILTRTECQRSVHCLEISGSMGEYDSHTNLQQSSQENTQSTSQYDLELDRNEMTQLEQEFFSSEATPRRKPRGLRRNSVCTSQTQDQLWDPLVDLLNALPALNDLVFNCDCHIPKSILLQLQTNLPRCRLHVQSLRIPCTSTTSIEPQDGSTDLSWTNLHRVDVHQTTTCSGFREGDCSEEAVLRLASGGAPNLKAARVFGCSRNSMFHQGETKEPLQETEPLQLGQLTSLSLDGLNMLKPDRLELWSRHTDFNNLRHLTLGGSQVSYDALIWATETACFSNLESLDICLRATKHGRDSPGHDYLRAATDFFNSLPPLSALTIRQNLDSELVTEAIRTHGSTLRYLSLQPTRSRLYSKPFSHPMVTTIRDNCPVLEELKIPITRSKSNTDETKMYKTFGDIKSLKRLHLQLDFQYLQRVKSTPDDASHENDVCAFVAENLIRETFSEAECTDNCSMLKNSQMRDLLLNAATDEHLAESIWNTINGSSCRLESLLIHPNTDAYTWWTTPLEFSSMLRHITRSYLVRRSVRNSDAIIVKELGRQRREQSEEWNSDGEYYRAVYQPNKSPLDLIRRIWPGKGTAEDCWDTWSSVPLAME